MEQQASGAWGDVPGPRQKEDQKQRQQQQQQLQQQRPRAQVYVEVDGVAPPGPAAGAGSGVATAAAAAANTASLCKPVAQPKPWLSKHPGQVQAPKPQAARPFDMGPRGGAASGGGSGATGGSGGGRDSPYHATAYHNPYPTFSGLPMLPRTRSGQLQGPLLPPPYGTGPLQSPAPAAAAAAPAVPPPQQQPRPWSAAASAHCSTASGLSGYPGGGGGPGAGAGGRAAGSRGANPLYGRHMAHENFDGGGVAGVSSAGWPGLPALSLSPSQQRNRWSGGYSGGAQQAVAGAGQLEGSLKDRYGAALNGMLDNARWD